MRNEIKLKKKASPRAGERLEGDGKWVVLDSNQ